MPIISPRVRVAAIAILLTACAGRRNSAAPTVIGIDPGHPSEVADGADLRNGVTEVHVAWVVAIDLRAELERLGYKVVMTKTSEMQMVRNVERAEVGNRAHAALMVRL